MKSFWQNRSTSLLQLDRYLLMGIAFLLPLYKQGIPVLISMLILRWLLSGQFLRLPQAVITSRHRATILMFAVLYLIHLIGMINTNNIRSGLFDLEVKASLLIFPLIFVTLDPRTLEEKWMIRVWFAFIGGCLSSLLFGLGRAFWMWQQSGDIMSFFYTGLSYSHHPSYLALYLNLAIALVTIILVEHKSLLTKTFRIFLILLLALFMVFIVLLSSKAGILGLVITLVISMMYLIIRQKLMVEGILGFLLSITFLLLMLNAFPYSVLRLKTASAVMEAHDEVKKDDTEGTAERILIWQAGLRLAWEHFLTGAGTGDVKDVLMAEYEKKGMKAASEQRLNAHNQYLQTTVALGVIGLLVLILILLLPALQAYRQNNFPYFVFLVLLGFNLLFESMLETQAGVVFYAFFNVVLYQKNQ